MRTVHELRKNGEVWVTHITDGGQYKSTHLETDPCERCPTHLRRKYGKRTASGMPNVRHPRHGSASRPS